MGQAFLALLSLSDRDAHSHLKEGSRPVFLEGTCETMEDRAQSQPRYQAEGLAEAVLASILRNQ